MNVMMRELKLFKRTGAWMMFILTPLIIVLCISIALSGSVHHVPIGVASNNQQTSTDLVNVLNKDNGKISAKVVSVNNINQSFVSSNLESVILVKINSTGYPSATIFVDATVQSIKEQMKSYLTVLIYNYYNYEKVPITVVEEYSGYSLTDYYTASILVIAALMGGLFMASDSILRERETKTIESVIVTGFNTVRFTSEKIISFTLLQVIGSGLLYTLLVVLGLPVGNVEQLITIFLALILMQFIFVSIGFIMSSFVPNTEVAGALGGTVMFPLMFISGAFFSIYSMSPIIIPLAQINPVTLGQELFTTLILKGGNIADVSHYLYLLASFAIVTFIIANILIYRVTNSIKA